MPEVAQVLDDLHRRPFAAGAEGEAEVAELHREAAERGPVQRRAPFDRERREGEEAGEAETAERAGVAAGMPDQRAVRAEGGDIRGWSGHSTKLGEGRGRREVNSRRRSCRPRRKPSGHPRLVIMGGAAARRYP